jgi:hypothetical protein
MRRLVVTPCPSLTHFSHRIYLVDDLDRFASWLIDRQFDPILPRSNAEYSGFRDDAGHVVVVYRSRLVVVLGRDKTATHRLLAPLVRLAAPPPIQEVV